MGSFAAIPQIEANVAVPTTTRPFRPSPGSNVPEIKNPVEAAARPLAQGAGQLQRIIDVQADHQRILDSDAAEENFKSQITQSYIGAKQSLPGNQWAPTIATQGQQIADKMIADPANQHIAPYLQKRLPQLLAVMHNDALEAGAVETAKNQHDQYELLQKNMAGQAGADFVAKPDGSFDDGPTAQAIRQKQSSMVNAMWANNPDARAQLNSKFEQMVTQERGQAIARNQPTLLQSYLDKNSANFTPQEQGALLTTATQAISAPMRAIEANHASARAAAIQYQQQFITKNGQPDASRLAHDAQFGIIEPGDFQQISGRQYQMPTDPTIKANYDNQLKNASSIDEVESIKAAIRSAADHKLVSGADVPVYDDQAQKRIEYFKTEAGQETKTGIDQIRRAYQSAGSNGFIYNKIAPVMGLPTLTEIHQNALADFQAATAGVTDRAKINAAWHKAIDDNQPDYATAGIKIAAPKTPAPTLSDADLLKLARSKGIIH